MYPEATEYIHEYNYPIGHRDIMKHGTFNVLKFEGSCAKIQIDDQFYYLSKYDIYPVEQFPEELFNI